MSEAEILELLAIARSNLVGGIQWWASVTFGLIALTHFGRKSLSLPLVTIVASLYIAFTGWIGVIVVMQAREFDALRADVAALETESYALSQTALELVQAPAAVLFALRSLSAIAIFGAFASSIGYLIWTYRHASKQ